MGENAAPLLATGFGIQGLSSIGNAYSQSQAIEAQGAYQKSAYDFNSKVAEMESADVLKRGNRAISENKKATSSQVGAERADLAAQGVDVNSGTAREIQNDTQYVGALNAITISNNVWRESWGYKSQAIADTAAGRFSQLASETNYGNTLLTGGLNALSSLAQGGYYYKSGGKVKPGSTIGAGEH